MQIKFEKLMIKAGQKGDPFSLIVKEVYSNFIVFEVFKV